MVCCCKWLNYLMLFFLFYGLVILNLCLYFEFVFLQNVNCIVIDFLCNFLVIFVNIFLFYVLLVFEYGYGIKFLYGVVIGFVNRILFFLVWGVRIFSDIFRDLGIMFMVIFVKINQFIYFFGLYIKFLMLDLVGKGLVVVGDWLDIVCDVVIRFINGIMFFLV